MTATTISAMRTSLKTTVAALTPTGTAAGRTAYSQASEYEEWPKRAGSDIDREFTIEDFAPADVMSFGLASSSLLDTTFTLKIGHWKTGDLLAGTERRDTDIQQIVTALHDKSNYPTSVSLIRHVSTGRTDAAEHWVSTIRFRLLYEGAI